MSAFVVAEHVPETVRLYITFTTCHMCMHRHSHDHTSCTGDSNSGHEQTAVVIMTTLTIIGTKKDPEIF